MNEVLKDWTQEVTAILMNMASTGELPRIHIERLRDLQSLLNNAETPPPTERVPLSGKLSVRSHPDGIQFRHLGETEELFIPLNQAERSNLIAFLNKIDSAEPAAPTGKEMLRVSVDDGKYTVIQDSSGRLTALRYGQPWRDCVGDKLILSLAYELEATRESLQRLISKTGSNDVSEDGPCLKCGTLTLGRFCSVCLPDEK